VLIALDKFHQRCFKARMLIAIVSWPSCETELNRVIGSPVLQSHAGKSRECPTLVGKRRIPGHNGGCLALDEGLFVGDAAVETLGR
jgi:hypothetical protein